MALAKRPSRPAWKAAAVGSPESIPKLKYSFGQPDSFVCVQQNQSPTSYREIGTALICISRFVPSRTLPEMVELSRFGNWFCVGAN